MFDFSSIHHTKIRQIISEHYHTDEVSLISDIHQTLTISEQEQVDIKNLASRLVTKVRDKKTKSSGVDALMQEFSLSSEEGIALMCLAEALLRIPDNETRDALIKDKLSEGDWRSHINQSPSLFVNAASWGLLITGKLLKTNNEQNLSAALTRLLQKGGEPLIRQGVNYAMKILGKQFVTGETIEQALKNGKHREKKGYTYSFDMLGEAAMTQADADRYYHDYVQAIHAIGKDAPQSDIYAKNGISVKLSAIHPRYWRAQHERVMNELLPKLKQLFLLAKQYNIGLNIDAEEASRLELSLDLLTALLHDPDLQGFEGIGFVVQAYQKRCPFVIDYVIDIARHTQHKLMIRLVKGAYWDSEIKIAQVEGFDGYPVYTKKVHTDLAYLHCAQKLLAAQDVIYPQFATHNAQTLATIAVLAQGKTFEFQCLHGMGEALYDEIIEDNQWHRPVRIYAPVGSHKTLLAYLVRRLLENGANSSFVNRIVDESVSIDELTQSPIDMVSASEMTVNESIPLPRHLYLNEFSQRTNSKGINLNNERILKQLDQKMNENADKKYFVHPIVASDIELSNNKKSIFNPANHKDCLGEVVFNHVTDIQDIIEQAVKHHEQWASLSAQQRASYVRSFADLLEDNFAFLMMIAIRESGKTAANAVAEVREAIDFCRYYAEQAEQLENKGKPLGVVVAISPWNFPLAIFIGEVVSSLLAGNSVIAKPAEQTNLIAFTAVQLLHQAGVPKEALQLVLGAGDIGAELVNNKYIQGVIFTGSTEVARLIHHTLAQRDDNPVLIAETGGQNAMIVDSTALPEQVCTDVLASAFDSAGQRCSALRILCLQEDIADEMLAMIKGAMTELRVGNPISLATDIGPVIDQEAKDNLLSHINHLKATVPYYELNLADECQEGTFVAPILFELDDLSQLTKEVFGPVLHVIRYKRDELDKVIHRINQTGYALTHGIHSRIEHTVNHISQHIHAGNIYVNRNIVGAVVGVQPFGGHGLSGTGPKAGGSFYLQRLMRMNKWKRPSLSKSAEINNDKFEKLMHILPQLGLEESTVFSLKQSIEKARFNSLHHAEVELTGPTGEINILRWQAPKHVWVYGGDLETSVAVCATLILDDVQVAITNEHPLAKYQKYFEGLVNVSSENTLLEYQIVIALDKLPVSVKTALSERQRTIPKVIDIDESFDIKQIYHEVCISVNTTAAGGNASLMASA